MTLPRNLNLYCAQAEKTIDKLLTQKEDSEEVTGTIFVAPTAGKQDEVAKYLHQNGISAQRMNCFLNDVCFESFRINTFTKAQYQALKTQQFVYGIFTLEGMPWDFFNQQEMV